VWQAELAQSYDSVASLADAGLLAPAEAARLHAVGEAFRVRITPYYAGLMRADDPACPIRRQAIPGLGETDPELPGWAREWSLRAYGRETPWTADAIGDVARLAAPRLTHRYGNRAILHLSSLCAVYCRFCFRKSHLNDGERTLYEGALDPSLDYVARTAAIRELILTGGDPLSVTDAALARLLERLAAIPHLKTVRLHTRMAVTLPSRLTPELAALLGRPWPFQIVFVSHFNHPREWTAEARAGLRSLRRAGVTLLNQNVLLRGINDSAAILTELYQGLYEEGVIPYYLHHADWTPGTFHFRVSLARGHEILRELQGDLPGPAIPRYILDLPGGGGKIPIMPQYMLKKEGKDITLRNFRQQQFHYVEP
jgi:lysine 2,3-aminomutase